MLRTKRSTTTNSHHIYFAFAIVQRDSFHSLSKWWWLMPNERENTLFPLEFDQFTTLDIIFFFHSWAKDKWNKKRRSRLFIQQCVFFSFLSFITQLHTSRKKNKWNFSFYVTYRYCISVITHSWDVKSIISQKVYFLLLSRIWTKILFWIFWREKKLHLVKKCAFLKKWGNSSKCSGVLRL